MSYVDVHRMWFTNDEGNDVIIHFSDTTSGTGASVFSDMKDADGSWLTMSAKLATANDGEDKLSTIRSLRFSCEFLSTDTYNVDFFVEGEDNRWLVEVYMGTTSNPAVFTGFLVPEGAKDIFLDHGLYGVELTASDYLQTTSEALLRKPDGSIPKGKFKLIEYLSWALSKTFLSLPIKVVYNLREENHTGADDHFFKMIYEEALSFETDINERGDCLTVIRKILLGCFICQHNSQWWIVRVDEMTNASYRVASFNADGTYVSTTTQNFTKLIGLGETIQLINEDAAIFPERKVQFVKQNFRFETWQEIICNINYQRGTFNPTITATLPSGGGYEAYNPVDCWINGKNPHGSLYTAPDVAGYMRKIIQNNYEIERILVLPQSSYRPHYWQTGTVEVNRLDKFNFSVDRKLSDDHTGSGWNTTTIFKIRLRGYDGSFWAMIGNATNGKVGSWKQGTGGFPVQAYDWIYQPSTEDESQWTTHSVEVDPCPVAGWVDIMLFQTNIYGDVSETHFSNVRFDYIPIIDGVYQKVTGQYNKVFNTDSRKANKEEEIFISDAVSPNWKGVLFRDTGTAFVRIGNVYDYNLGTSGGLGLSRFSKWQAFALWNQYNRTVRKFQGDLKGLEVDLPSMIHKFYFTASSVITDNRIYQMLGFDMDLATGLWSATFADVYDTGDGKDYSSSWEFKYTTK
jgi:hypothetical protein